MSLDVAALIAQGYRIAPAGNGTAAGFDVTTPDGRHGTGATVEDAIANIDAQIIPDGDGRRFLHRTNGEVIAMDAAGAPQNDTVDGAALDVAVSASVLGLSEGDAPLIVPEPAEDVVNPEAE